MAPPTLLCGGPTLRLRDWFRGGASAAIAADAWPQLRGRTVIGTYRGRTAIALACRLLGIGPGHEVLVPAYNCGTEIDALLQSGARVVGYRVSQQCEVDVEDLKARRSNRTRAVYLIHYFGWEQPMGELRRWCDDQGLLLIEDCALSLFSDGTTGAIGRMGDASIFSLPKTLGFHHGGLLSMPAPLTVELPHLKPAGLRVLVREIRNSTRATAFRGLESLGLYGTALSLRRSPLWKFRPLDADASAGGGGARPDIPRDYYFDAEADADRTIHSQVWLASTAFSADDLIRRRRSNYLRLAGELQELDGAKLLYADLPDGICPLCLPVVVANRDAYVALLQAKGIAAPPWWAGFHRNGIDWTQFPEACWLKHNILTLPIHQGMDDRHLSYVAKAFVQALQSTEIIHGISHR